MFSWEVLLKPIIRAGIFILLAILIYSFGSFLYSFSPASKMLAYTKIKDNIVKEIKSTPYKDLKEKYSDKSGCIIINDSYCYKSSISFLEDEHFANIHIQIYNKNKLIEDFCVNRTSVKQLEASIKTYSDDNCPKKKIYDESENDINKQYFHVRMIDVE